MEGTNWNWQDIGKLVESTISEALRERGHANVIIIGRTGVGKSTLVNSTFQGNLAQTGQGRPVTQQTREFTKEGIPISIFDTRGLELADFGKELAALRVFITERSTCTDAQKHIHVAWVCMDESLRRVESAESDLVAMLAELMPVVAVVTKAHADDGFRAEVQRLLPQAKNVVRVRAIPSVLDDGHVLPPMGLVELVQLTMELLPEGHKRAFIAAQKADMALKRKQSHLAVATAAAAAAAIGATPIPFADAFLIVPVQLTMLARITVVYGLSFSEGFLSSLIACVVGSTVATLSGRAIVSSLLKLIPGVGSVVGGAISAGTAAVLTTTLGEVYIAVLDKLFTKNHGEAPTPDEVLLEFKKLLANKRPASELPADSIEIPAGNGNK